jgi:hypothetical protein
MTQAVLEDLLALFTTQVDSALEEAVKEEIKSDYKKFLNFYTVFKYERRFFALISTRRRGSHFRKTLIIELIKKMRDALRSDFTTENLLAHHNLVKNGLLHGYLSVFLAHRVRETASRAARDILSSGQFTYGYHGSFDATINFFERVILECYHACVREVVRKVGGNGAPGPELSQEIDAAAKEGLRFEVKNGVFGYASADIDAERDEFLKEIRAEIESIEPRLKRLDNEHARLVRAIRCYATEIKKDEPDAFRLFVYGSDIQYYINRNENELRSQGADDDRSMRMVLDALDSLLVRHAVIVLGSPAISETVRRYEQFRSISSDDPARQMQPFERTVGAIASAATVFDAETRQLAGEVVAREQGKALSGAQEAAAAAMTRGSLAAFGKVARAIEKGVQDGVADVAKSETRAILQDETLRRRIKIFLQDKAQDIAELVARYPGSLGWAAGILRFFLGDR